MTHGPKLPKTKVSKHVALISQSTWNSLVMTRGTHSGPFGCVILPFPCDTYHPSFHDTSTTMTSYDIRSPRHSGPVPLREISKHEIHKLPKSRSEYGLFINKDMWRQIIYFDNFPSREFQEQHSKLLKPKIPK
jgi:hypothetical protein